MLSPSAPLILIADDDEDTRAMLQEFLRMHGFATVTAADGADALELAVRAVPSAALLDVLMPTVTGVEVARRLRADPRTAGIRLFATTGLAARDSREQLSVFDRIVVKPYDLDALVTLLRAMAPVAEAQVE